MATQQELFQMSYPNFNFFVQDFHAQLGASQEKDKDFLTTHEGRSFLISQGFLPYDSRGTWYSKTFKVYLTTTREGVLNVFSESLPKLGMKFNGNYSIVGISESHKAENECTLSDIMEQGKQHPKYSLSSSTIDEIKSRAKPSDKTPVQVLDRHGKTKRNQTYASTLTVGAHGAGNHSDMDILAITERTDDGDLDLYVRRFTPTEWERLQGFPDGWTGGLSDTQRFKQMGNAVTVNVVETVMRRLFRSEDTSDNE